MHFCSSDKMLNSDMGMTDVIITEEELMEQKILAQKKEKKVSTDLVALIIKLMVQTPGSNVREI